MPSRDSDAEIHCGQPAALTCRKIRTRKGRVIGRYPAPERDLDEHDRLIALVLGLSHALNIAFFSALAASGIEPERLKAVSSTTFGAQLAIAEGVAAENPQLYFEIQSLNEHNGTALAALDEAVHRLLAAVRSGDEAAFVALMQRGREYLHTPAE